MKAWQFTAVHEPLVLSEVAEPSADPGWVVIDVKASGLCHSDVGVLEDPHFPSPPGGPRPMTLGHEIAGVIAELGAGVSGWRIGDRVGIVCVDDPAPGLSMHGGFAPKVAVPAEYLVVIPEGLDFPIAAAATDSGVAPHHAVVAVAGVTPGARVGIIGLGGLGQVGARLAVLEGGEVYVAEIREELWPTARDIGAVRVARDITAFADEKLDVIIDFAGMGTTTSAALAVVRPGGRVVQVGMSARDSVINTYDIVTKRISLLGTMGGDTADLEGVYRYLESGALEPVISTIGFADIADGLARLSRGEVIGRLVAVL